MAASKRSLILIYNADGTIRGKLRYAYRKLTNSDAQNPACAACDITHGGLSLSESPSWTTIKTLIEEEGWAVEQIHRDEGAKEVHAWVKAQKVRYPVVLSKGTEGPPEVAVSSSELATCQGKPEQFYDLLITKEIIHGSKRPKQPSSL